MYFRLSLLAALMWAVPAALVPVYSVALEQLGFDKLTVALCCSTQAVAAMFAWLFAGQIADRWVSAEHALCACAALAGVDLWWLSTLRDPAAVFAFTLLFWVLCGPITQLGTAVCFTHLPMPAKQFGPVRMWGTVAWIAVGWLSGLWLWARQTPPSDVFRLGSLVAGVLAAYALTLPPTPPRPGRGFAPLAAFRLFRDRGFVVYTSCLFGASLTFPFSTQLTPLLLTDLGVTKEWLTPTLTVAQPLEVAGLFVLPGILAALGLRRTMLVGLSAWLVAMLVLSHGRPLGLVVPSLMLNGIYITCFTIAGQVYVNGLAEGDVKASVQGLFNCISGTGLLLGNLLAGGLRYATGDHLPSAFAVAAGITAVMVTVFALGFDGPRAETRDR
ncbi:MAG: MFS transporter [Gemmataceae bacterium]